MEFAMKKKSVINCFQDKKLIRYLIHFTFYILLLPFFFFSSPLFAQTTIFSKQEKTPAGKNYTLVTLENEYLIVRLIPELGVKIVSIFHKKLNREFLDRTEIFYEWRKYDMSFVDMERDGFDECFPSISRVPYPAGTWEGIIIPDHGEVCMVPGRYQQIAGAVITTTHGVRFPYEFIRKITLDRETLVLDYTVLNHSSESFSYLYAAHPLFRLEPEAKIELPIDAKVIDSSGKIEGWPIRLNATTNKKEDRSIIQPRSVNQMVKLFTRKLRNGWAVMHFPNGETIRVDFPSDKLHYLGLWITEGGWNGLYQFAFEPTNATTDILGEAYENGDAIMLQPFGSNTWMLRYTFSKE